MYSSKMKKIKLRFLGQKWDDIHLSNFNELQFQITESFSFFQIEEVDLVERRGYLTLRILVKNEPGRLLLRKTDGIRKWYQLIQVKLVETTKVI